MKIKRDIFSACFSNVACKMNKEIRNRLEVRLNVSLCEDKQVMYIV